MQNLNPEMTFGIKIHSMRQLSTWLFQSLSSSYVSNPLNHRPDENKQEAKSVNRTEIEAANMRTGVV